MSFTILFWVVCAVYLVGWLICCLAFFKNQQKPNSLGDSILFLAFCLQLLLVTTSYIQIDNFLFHSFSGLLLLLSLLFIAIYFILNFYYPNQIFKVIFPPLTLFFLLLSVLISNQVIIPNEFLEKSPVFGKLILFTHASFSMLGYLLFGVACLTSVFFLYLEKKIKNKTLMLQNVKVPSLGYLDTLVFKVIFAGFLFLTVGLLLGVNMKIITHEGLPLGSLRQGLPALTWLVYALFLIERSLHGRRGRTSAIWAILGFAFAVVSFFYEMTFLIARN